MNTALPLALSGFLRGLLGGRFLFGDGFLGLLREELGGRFLLRLGCGGNRRLRSALVDERNVLVRVGDDLPHGEIVVRHFRKQ